MQVKITQLAICNINANPRTVADIELPQIRMLQLVSTGQDTGFSKDEWRSM